MNGFNIAEASLKSKSILIYFIICILLGGTFAYIKLGRMENPDFTVRQMIISAAWHGATAKQMQDTVLNNLEKALQKTPYLDYLKSCARPGEAIIYVVLKDICPKNEVRRVWQEVRNIASDAARNLPAGIQGPFYNDRFGDTFCSIYALIGNGYSYEEKRRYAERIRRKFLEIDAVKQVELIGVQKERIYLTTYPEKLSAIGLSVSDAQSALSKISSIIPAGMFETSGDNIHIRINGTPENITDIENVPVSIGDHIMRIKDIASIKMGNTEPAEPKMYFNGMEAVGIAVSMEEGGNIITLGKNLKEAVKDISANMPAGLEIHMAADQPEIVNKSINEFIKSIAEAVAIVLFISFLSLGIRTGFVISLCIPMVFAGVFIIMYIFGIDMHTVSLGSLIIALGLLVDDEIIVAEIISVKLQEGVSPYTAASQAYKETAMPMLSGTIITCAGFIPIGFARGEISEFTSAIFPVLSSALLISWIVSITVAPFLAYRLIKVNKSDSDNSKFYRIFRNFLMLCLANRKKVIVITVICFAVSLYSMKFLKQEFFPAGKRDELLVKITLPEGSSMRATEKTAANFASYLDSKDGVKNYFFHIGEGAPRFISTLNPALPAPNIAEFVIRTENTKIRDLLKKDIETFFIEKCPEALANIRVINMGPAFLYPVMIRITGENTEKVKQIAEEAAKILRSDPNLKNINCDWKEQGKAILLKMDASRVASFGADREHISKNLYGMVSGTKVSEYYQNDRIIDVVFRLDDESRAAGNPENMPIILKNGSAAALSQVADTEYVAEDVSVWRRNLSPSITLSADTIKGTPNDMTEKASADLKELRRTLPAGYKIEIAGNLEESRKSLKKLIIPVPIMIFIIFTVLMLQLKRFSLAVMALLTAPLGIIGVFPAMFFTGKPMGFVAQIGIIALAGMIIRNSIILIEQTEKYIKEGNTPYNSVIMASVFRFRPIMLTAATAILAMIPLMVSNFWGPMAVSISGGLFAGTVLTLIVLPCAYALLFKIKES